MKLLRGNFSNNWSTEQSLSIQEFTESLNKAISYAELLRQDAGNYITHITLPLTIRPVLTSGYPQFDLPVTIKDNVQVIGGNKDQLLTWIKENLYYGLSKHMGYRDTSGRIVIWPTEVFALLSFVCVYRYVSECVITFSDETDINLRTTGEWNRLKTSFLKQCILSHIDNKPQQGIEKLLSDTCERYVFQTIITISKKYAVIRQIVNDGLNNTELLLPEAEHLELITKWNKKIYCGVDLFESESWNIRCIVLWDFICFDSLWQTILYTGLKGKTLNAFIEKYCRIVDWYLSHEIVNTIGSISTDILHMIAMKFLQVGIQLVPTYKFEFESGLPTGLAEYMLAKNAIMCILEDISQDSIYHNTLTNMVGALSMIEQGVPEVLQYFHIGHIRYIGNGVRIQTLWYSQLQQVATLGHAFRERELMDGDLLDSKYVERYTWLNSTLFSSLPIRHTEVRLIKQALVTRTKRMTDDKMLLSIASSTFQASYKDWKMKPLTIDMLRPSNNGVHY